MRDLHFLSSTTASLRRCRPTLEALAVHNGRSTLVILLLGDPHLLESRQRSEDGATNPDRVFALRRRDDFHSHRGWREGGDLLLHAIRDTRVHGSTAGLASH